MAKIKNNDLIVARNIEKLHKKSKLSLKEFAEDIGVHPNTFSNYIKAKTSPPANVIIKICQLYNVSSEWLLGLDEVVKDVDEDKDKPKDAAEEVVLKDYQGKIINQHIDLYRVSALYLGKYLSIEEIADRMKETEGSVRWALKKLGYR